MLLVCQYIKEKQHYIVVYVLDMIVDICLMVCHIHSVSSGMFSAITHHLYLGSGVRYNKLTFKCLIK